MPDDGILGSAQRLTELDQARLVDQLTQFGLAQHFAQLTITEREHVGATLCLRSIAVIHEVPGVCEQE